VIGKIFDITRPLGATTAAWPGDVAFSRRWTQAHGTVTAAVSCLQFSPHLGTHLDAPLHVDPHGRDVAAVPLSICVGPCEVFGLPGHDRAISEYDLPSGWKPVTPRVLFATWTWALDAPIPPTFASLAPRFVDFLARSGAILVGIDTPSVDDPTAVELPAHRRCVAQSIAILEGLDFSGVIPGAYTLVAAPLRLTGVEASPVRAFLLPATTVAAGAVERVGPIRAPDA
jgi:arylformamidase